MDMYAQKAHFVFVLAIFLIFISCEQMDTVFLSTGTYQVKALVNNISLDDCSLISADDNVQPYFVNYTSNDPDITGLVVFLEDARGEIPESRVHFDLDKDLTLFPMPEELPAGYYSMVFRIMGGKKNLYQTEKTFYYLADKSFSFRDIQVYLPSAGAESALVPKSATVMLEARVDFDSTLDPYIIWYDEIKIISEGSFSDGAGRILWKAPEQNGFLSLRAEVFPVRARQGIAGSSREISLPVSSKAPAAALLSDDIPGILHWYVLEGDLKDSMDSKSESLNLKPEEKKEPRWIPAGGSYGLAAGPIDVYMLPLVTFTGTESGQFIFRFKPAADGSIFTAQFGSSADIEMNLSLESENLILSLISPMMAVKETYGPLSDDFITAMIDFTIKPDRIKAKLNVKEKQDESSQKQSTAENISLAALLDGECRVFLGAAISQKIKTESPDTEAAHDEQAGTEVKEYFTAVWDEFAILRQ